tara:strand:- start:9794 stop:10738 length:945 start_codon:yes stop_codon:yes gene_type:complete
VIDEAFEQALRELHTIRDILRWGTSQFNEAGLFYGHGTDNAWDEALALTLHALHLSHDSGTEILDSRLTHSEKQSILALFRRRIIDRIPVPYLTQEAWFAGLPFYVDERVIVPRSPIAELIENGFSPWADSMPVRRVLDLCTGSGCIAIACAMAFPDAYVDGVELCNDALAVAQLNVAKYDCDEHVSILQSDLFDAVRDERYDIIVSNPPYVARTEMDELPHEYQHEPEKALHASDEGIAIAIKILQQAGQHLTDEGFMVVEVGNSQWALQERFPEVPFLWLEFERGGEGVFLMTAQELKQYHDIFAKESTDAR